MEAEDSGIFLFAGSKSKTKTVVESVVEVPVLVEEIPKVEEVWKARPKVKRSLPVLTDDLKKTIVVSGEDIIRMASIYAKTEADIKVKLDRKKKPSTRAKRRTRKQRRVAKLCR